MTATLVLRIALGVCWSLGKEMSMLSTIASAPGAESYATRVRVCLRAALGLAAATALLAGSGLSGLRGQEVQEDPWYVAPEAIAAARSAKLFQSHELLEFTLSAEFHTIRREDRDPEAEEGPPDRPATLTLRLDDGSERTLELNVQTRGNWRLNRSNCDFPPLWLDFKKDSEDLIGTPFEGQNRIKLYVTCKPGRDEYEQYSIKEYLTYPIFNLLTEASFRARPVRVTYVDTSGEDDTFSRFAFLLEHKDAMAARNEATAFDAGFMHPLGPDQEAIALVEIYNYLIGMTDYSAVYSHNVELVRTMDGTIVTVPYDTDWSGLVRARYARPDPSLPIRRVTQRYFQGYCRDVDYEALLDRFQARRTEIVELYRDFPLLEDDHRENAVEFLEEFFELLERDDRVQRITRSCKDMPPA
jgi:hypothetical protein